MAGWRHRRTRALAVGAGAALALFVLLALAVRAGWTPLRRLDLRIARDLNGDVVAHPTQLRLWRDVSAVLGPAQLRIAGVLAGVVLWVRRRRRAAVLLGLPVLLTAALSPITKAIVDRPRPHVPVPVASAAGQSFPSGHALTSFTLALAVTLALGGTARRVVGAVALLLAAAVAFSRLALGVHYLSDIIGAWLLGAAAVALVLVVMERLPFLHRR